MAQHSAGIRRAASQFLGALAPSGAGTRAGARRGGFSGPGVVLHACACMQADGQAVNLVLHPHVHTRVGITHQYGKPMHVDDAAVRQGHGQQLLICARHTHAYHAPPAPARMPLTSSPPFPSLGYAACHRECWLLRRCCCVDSASSAYGDQRLYATLGPAARACRTRYVPTQHVHTHHTHNQRRPGTTVLSSAHNHSRRIDTRMEAADVTCASTPFILARGRTSAARLGRVR